MFIFTLGMIVAFTKLLDIFHYKISQFPFRLFINTTWQPKYQYFTRFGKFLVYFELTDWYVFFSGFQGIILKLGIQKKNMKGLVEYHTCNQQPENHQIQDVGTLKKVGFFVEFFTWLARKGGAKNMSLIHK